MTEESSANIYDAPEAEITVDNDVVDGPQGVSGWLLAYFILPICLGNAAMITFLVIAGPSFSMISAVPIIGLIWIYVGASVFGGIMMFTRYSWVRHYHIVLNIAAILLGLAGSSFGGVLVNALWAGYWYQSKRVSNTYNRG